MGFTYGSTSYTRYDTREENEDLSFHGDDLSYRFSLGFTF